MVIGQDPVESAVFAGALEASPDKAKDAGRLWVTLRSDRPLSADGFTKLAEFVEAVLAADAELTGPQTKQLAAAFAAGKGSVTELLKDPAFAPMDESDLEATVNQAIADNPKPAEDFKKGNENAAQAIVGSVMKATKGSADPRKVSQLIREKLSKS